MIKDYIYDRIQSVLNAMQLKASVKIDYPAISDFGDYSSNVAMQLAGTLKKNPMDIAADIAGNIKPDDIIEKAEAAKPGFINFFITKKALLDNLNSITAHGENYGRSKLLNNKKVILEFTDPNPFKEFHVGHLYSNIVGESLSRLYESIGADVMRVTYQGDVGMHVAKSLWGMRKLMNEENLALADLEKEPLEDRVTFLGRAYAAGASAYEENEITKSEIAKVNKGIYINSPEYMTLYTAGRNWSLAYFDKIYERIGTRFDKNFFESEVGSHGVQIVRKNIGNGIFRESEGAVIFPGEDFGLHTRVFINSSGLPTYEAKELGLAPAKYEWFPYDESIIITGNEIIEYFNVLLCALEKISPDLRKKTKHISHGMVRLPEGKMSSRTGKIIKGEWLLDEAAKKAHELMQQSRQRNTDNQKELGQNEPGWITDTAESIGKAAVKYALLKISIGHNVEFSFDESINFDGNSGPYLQYTYVRCRAVVEKSPLQLKELRPDDTIPLNQEESILMRTLLKFPEIVIDSALHFSPNILSNYLYDIAQKFNLFYQKHPILRVETETMKLRILLTHSVSQVLDNGLSLLGIQTVEKM